MRKRIGVAVVLAVLLAASTYAQTTDFFELVQTGTPQSIQAAISKGADIKARYKGGPGGWGSGMTPLLLAVYSDRNPEVIAVLLKAGADINARTEDGETALMLATNPEVIATLLKAGADVNARTEGGWTVLMLAATFNTNPEAITMLLKAGADAKAKSNAGKTAFDYAQENKKLQGTDAYRRLQEASK